jgi:hypothetical protein
MGSLMDKLVELRSVKDEVTVCEAEVSASSGNMRFDAAKEALDSMGILRDLEAIRRQLTDPTQMGDLAKLKSKLDAYMKFVNIYKSAGSIVNSKGISLGDSDSDDSFQEVSISLKR